MPLALPHGKRLAVALTADFDAQSNWMADNNVSPGYLSRGEFGAEVGLPRLLALFRRYEIKATFSIPVHTMLTYPAQVEAILAGGHEAAAHGVYHERILGLEPERERELMAYQVEQHERIVGRRPRGYRSPSWDFSAITLALLEEYGFDWDSSLMGRDYEPYHPRPVALDFMRGNTFGPPSRILELPVSWYLDDLVFVEFIPSIGFPGATAPQVLFERWKDTLDYGLANAPNGVYILTVHPQSIGRAPNIMMLEKLVAYMREQDGVWFAALSQIYDCWVEP
ncbi:MAG: polysaccharide deacetylase family protein [Anaerolineae bacterium]